MQWDIWNEPNITLFWNRPQSQYFELWRRTYQRHPRRRSPATLIVGPSCAGVPSTSGWWTQYLDYVKANNVVPDIFSWHSLPGDPVANVATANTTLDSRGIAHPRPYQINEYGAPNEQNPGDGAWYIARLERAGADGLRANWASGGNLHNDLGNLLIRNSAGQYQPKGEWWVYRFYASQTGQIAVGDPQPAYDAFATKTTGVGEGPRRRRPHDRQHRRQPATPGHHQRHRAEQPGPGRSCSASRTTAAARSRARSPSQDTIGRRLSSNATTVNLPHTDLDDTFTDHPAAARRTAASSPSPWPSTPSSAWTTPT